MGYTNYFEGNGKVADEVQKKAFDTIIKLCMDHKDILAGGHGDGEPELTQECICINGKDEESHEIFLVQKELVEYSFCKTARLPYDLVVMASLIILKYYYGDAIKIDSDGIDFEPEHSEDIEFDDEVVEAIEEAKKYLPEGALDNVCFCGNREEGLKWKTES